MIKDSLYKIYGSILWLIVSMYWLGYSFEWISYANDIVNIIGYISIITILVLSIIIYKFLTKTKKQYEKQN